MLGKKGRSKVIDALLELPAEHASIAIFVLMNVSRITFALTPVAWLKHQLYDISKQTLAIEFNSPFAGTIHSKIRANSTTSSK